MKKLISVFMLLCFVMVIEVSAQKARLNIYAGYAFDDQFDSYYDAYNYYEGKIEGSLQWGAGIEYMPHQATGVEVLYLRQDTKAPTRWLTDSYNGTVQYAELDLAMNYIMLAGNRHFGKPGGAVEGFAGLMLGMVVASAERPATNFDAKASASTTKFAWGLKGGIDIWVSDAVGIKLMGQMVSATQSMGGGFYFGTGGTGAGLSSYSSIYQFTLGGGLAFRLGGGGSGSGGAAQ